MDISGICDELLEFVDLICSHLLANIIYAWGFGAHRE